MENKEQTCEHCRREKHIWEENEVILRFYCDECFAKLLKPWYIRFKNKLLRKIKRRTNNGIRHNINK